ncbi:hypothetical protein [Bhargavaea beijingensis]|uniref:Uncharacterized protein n=1 Tax=Bhargavaea beijingensis TaxID=426756 RepID=A0A1G6YP99_9BACL|nr:hypothetical protein [Bhargavaea beijingensis]MCW1928636.1 hypothetical protein [Bhargavaea beijingensis]RSK36662.1 hypothetical protein EJA12_02630 [Bhargavaea beijingensis]SDD92334.1 hypothetical protein SAMN04488126_10239 [Bhargavaea beijingensis]
MRKWFLMLVLLLAGCSAEQPENEKAEGGNNEKPAAEETASDKDGAVVVDKGLVNVEVTIPAAFFEGEDMDQVIKQAKEEGIGEAVLNRDGSVTYKMSKAKHKEMMKELSKALEQSIADFEGGEDFPSIREISHDQKFETFTVTVDREQFENSLDGFSLFGLGLAGSYYQLFNGEDPENYRVIIELNDAATGESFDEVVFPDALEEMEQNLEEGQ